MISRRFCRLALRFYFVTLIVETVAIGAMLLILVPGSVYYVSFVKCDVSTVATLAWTLFCTAVPLGQWPIYFGVKREAWIELKQDDIEEKRP